MSHTALVRIFEDGSWDVTRYIDGKREHNAPAGELVDSGTLAESADLLWIMRTYRILLWDVRISAPVSISDPFPQFL